MKRLASLMLVLSMTIVATDSSSVLAATPVPDGLPAYQCAGDYVHMVPLDVELGDYGQQSGMTQTESFNTGAGANGTCNCPSSINDYSLFTATASLPETDGWLKLNENVSARVWFYIYGPGNVQMPFYQRRNAGRTSCSNTATNSFTIATGSRGKIEFRIDKGILGESRFSGELAKLYWQVVSSGVGAPDYSFPFSTVNANIVLSSSASCTFEAGDNITVDLGEVTPGQLAEGKPPGGGYIPRQIDLSVNCNNVADTSASHLEYFISAAGTPNADGPYIVTTMPGLGVAMTDLSGNLLGLGNQNSRMIPYHNGRAENLVQLYPTLVPSEGKIEPGAYSATAIVTVSIP
uniref:fimbrial protein n=1 Tax=Halomonas sp. TaxID=1486246 RepID=UPI0026192BB0|nr:fimbrial protein [Halomonas sp.]